MTPLLNNEWPELAESRAILFAPRTLPREKPADIYEALLRSVSRRMVIGRSSFCARPVKTASSSSMTAKSMSAGAVAASMAAIGSSINRQAFAGDLLIHRASWSPHCLSAWSSCSDSLIGGICAKAHLLSELGCLDPANRPSGTENFFAGFSQGAVSLQTPTVRYRA